MFNVRYTFAGDIGPQKYFVSGNDAYGALFCSFADFITAEMTPSVAVDPFAGAVPRS